MAFQYWRLVFIKLTQVLYLNFALQAILVILFSCIHLQNLVQFFLRIKEEGTVGKFWKFSSLRLSLSFTLTKYLLWIQWNVLLLLLLFITVATFRQCSGGRLTTLDVAELQIIFNKCTSMQVCHQFSSIHTIITVKLILISKMHAVVYCKVAYN